MYGGGGGGGGGVRGGSGPVGQTPAALTPGRRAMPAALSAPRARLLLLCCSACSAMMMAGAELTEPAARAPVAIEPERYPPDPGGILWFECRPGSGPCNPKPSWPVTYAMNESVSLMAFTTGLAADGHPASYPGDYPAVTGTTVPAGYPANRWAIFDIDWNTDKPTWAPLSTSARASQLSPPPLPPHPHPLPAAASPGARQVG